MTFFSPLLSVIRKNNTDTFDYSYLLNMSKFMHLKVYSLNYILNFRDEFNYFFVARGGGFPLSFSNSKDRFPWKNISGISTMSFPQKDIF